jgi:hypothetical protein
MDSEMGGEGGREGGKEREGGVREREREREHDQYSSSLSSRNQASSLWPHLLCTFWEYEPELFSLSSWAKQFSLKLLI